MVKRILAALLVLVMLAIMASCGCAHTSIGEDGKCIGCGEQINTPEGDDPSGDDKPGDDNPGDDTPGDDTPGSDNPGSDNLGDDTPGDDNLGGDTPGGVIDTPKDDF